MAKKKPKNKKDTLWAEAKRRCHLSAEDIRMRLWGQNVPKIVKRPNE